jgi:RES domain-containing protein
MSVAPPLCGAATPGGEQARRRTVWGGRWNSRGVAVVYTAAHRSLSILEVLVHVKDGSGIESVGNKADAARRLGIQRRLLYEKMKALGIASSDEQNCDPKIGA